MELNPAWISRGLHDPDYAGECPLPDEPETLKVAAYKRFFVNLRSEVRVKAAENDRDKISDMKASDPK